MNKGINRKKQNIKLFILILQMILCTYTFAVKEILILHSYHRGFQWTDDISKGIESVLGNEMEYSLHYEYLNNTRNSDKGYTEKLKELYKVKYQNIKLSGIIVVDNFALDFAIENRKEIFFNKPIVFCGINDFKESLIKKEKKITGIVEKADHRETINVMLSLHPKTKSIIVLTDRTLSGQKIKEEILQILPEYFGKVKIEVFEDFYLEEMFQNLRNLPKDTLIYMMVISKTIEYDFISEKEISKIFKEISIPFYGSWEIYLNKGLVGGKILRGFTQGKDAAEMMFRVLEGVEPEKIEIKNDYNSEYIFDYNALTRFNIPLKKLPAGSIVLNKPEKIVDNYLKIVVLIALFLTLSIIFILLKVFLNKKKEKDLVDRNVYLEEQVIQQTFELEKINREIQKQQEKNVKKAYKKGFIKVKTGMIKEIKEILDPLSKTLEEEIKYKEIGKNKEIEYLKKNVLFELENNFGKEMKLSKQLETLPKVLETMKHKKNEELKRLKYCEKEINHLKDVIRVQNDNMGSLNNENYYNVNEILTEVLEEYKFRDDITVEKNLKIVEKIRANKSKLSRVFNEIIQTLCEELFISTNNKKILRIVTEDEENDIKIIIAANSEPYTEEFIKNMFNLSSVANDKRKRRLKIYGCYQTIKKTGGEIKVSVDKEKGNMYIMYLPK